MICFHIKNYFSNDQTSFQVISISLYLNTKVEQMTTNLDNPLISLGDKKTPLLPIDVRTQIHKHVNKARIDQVVNEAMRVEQLPL